MTTKLLVTNKGYRGAISTDGGLFTSIDNSIKLAAFKDASTMFAITGYRALTKLTNNGTIETELTMPNSNYANCVAYKNNKLYVGNTNGILVSQDDGDSFTVYQENWNITHIKIGSNGYIYYLASLSGYAYIGVLNSSGNTIVPPTIITVLESGRNITCENAESLAVMPGAGNNGADVVIVAGYARGSVCVINTNGGSGSFSTFYTGLESFFNTECVHYDGTFLYAFGGVQDSSVTPAGFGIARSASYQEGSFVGMNIPGENLGQPYHIATLSNSQEIYLPLKGIQPPNLPYGNYLLKAVERTDGSSGFNFTFQPTFDNLPAEYVASYEGTGVSGGSGGQGGNGGGAGSGVTVPALNIFNGNAVILNQTSNPTQVEYRLANNDSLSVGSIVKLTSGQKFIKISGDVMAFQPISVTAPADWNLSSGGQAAWSILQDM